jgi:hypothetical protein
METNMLRSFKFGKPAFFFDTESGGGGGETTDTTTSTETTPDAGDKGGKSYTQEDLDRLFADRANRASEAERKKLYESLGVKDEAEFQAFLKAKKEQEDKNKTEAQKALDDLNKEKTASAEKDTRIAELNKRLLDTEIKQVAGRAVTDKDGKVTRPAALAAALERIPGLINRTLISEKDGKNTGIEEALAELVKSDAYLFEAATTGKQDGKGTPKPADRKLQPEKDGKTESSGLPKIAL